MVYLTTLSTYLQQSSLLLSAYPDTTRITTKYTLPPTSSSKRSRRAQNSKSASTPSFSKPTNPDASAPETDPPARKRKQATLTFKTYEPSSGICLKYKTDKQAEVGRLMTGLGRLARGEDPIPPPAPTADGDKMDVDGGTGGEAAAVAPTTTTTGGGGGGKKKKKGKK